MFSLANAEKKPCWQAVNGWTTASRLPAKVCSEYFCRAAIGAARRTTYKHEDVEFINRLIQFIGWLRQVLHEWGTNVRKKDRCFLCKAWSSALAEPNPRRCSRLPAHSSGLHSLQWAYLCIDVVCAVCREAAVHVCPGHEHPHSPMFCIAVVTCGTFHWSSVTTQSAPKSAITNVNPL